MNENNGLVLAKVQAGERLNLSKTAQDNNLILDKVMVGLGWDENSSGSAHDFDADVSMGFLTNGKCKDQGRFLYYNTEGLILKDGADMFAQHSGDNRTGEGDGDDESIAVVLSKVPSDVTEIAVYVTIHDAVVRSQTFGMLNNCYIRIVDVASGTEMMRWDLDFDASTDNAVTFGSLIKRSNDWYFSANKVSEEGGLGGITSRIGF